MRMTENSDPQVTTKALPTVAEPHLYKWIVSYRIRSTKSSRWEYDICQIETTEDLMPITKMATVIKNRYCAYQVEVLMNHREHWVAVITTTPRKGA